MAELQRLVGSDPEAPRNSMNPEELFNPESIFPHDSTRIHFYGIPDEASPIADWEKSVPDIVDVDDLRAQEVRQK